MHWVVTLNCSCLFLQEAIGFVRRFVKEVIASTDGNLTRSLLTLLECLFQPVIPGEVRFCCYCMCAPVALKGSKSCSTNHWNTRCW